MLATVQEDDLSVNSYGTAGPTTNNKQPVRKNSMIRKNDNYFMNTNTYVTDVPGSYRLENLNAPNNGNGTSTPNRKKNLNEDILIHFTRFWCCVKLILNLNFIKNKK